jgi:hypothetical protein
MNEISLANQRLRQEVGDRFTEEKSLSVSREEFPWEAKQLSGRLRTQLRTLRNQLSKLVPDDFGYTVELGDEEPSLQLSYNNGPMTQFCWWESVKSWLSLADQLNEINWSEQRQKGVVGGEIFDEMQEAAKDAPENIPSTKRLQKKFGEQMDAFVKAAQTDRTKVQVLLVTDDCGVLELEHFDFEDLKSFTGELPNLMTCAHHVIAVVARGKVVPAAEIDRMKRAALEELEDMPISYAQASGRMFPPTVLDA